MAPSSMYDMYLPPFDSSNYMYPTATTATPGYITSSWHGTTFAGYTNTAPTIKVESKKEKTARIAKEKMLASWKIYNDKKFKIQNSIN